MTVQFYKLAEREFDDAASWYERQLPGLGEQFRSAVKAALDRIQLFPEAGVPLGPRTRRCLVSRFPYGVVYRLVGNNVHVVAIAHLHREPEYWARRIR